MQWYTATKPVGWDPYWYWAAIAIPKFVDNPKPITGRVLHTDSDSDLDGRMVNFAGVGGVTIKASLLDLDGG